MIIKRKYFSSNEKKDNSGRDAIISIGAGAGAFGLSRPGKFGDFILDNADELISKEGELYKKDPKVLNKIRQDVFKNPNIDTKVSKDKSSAFISGFKNSNKPEKPIIIIDKNDINSPSIVAHEYGHYKNYESKSGISDEMYKKSKRFFEENRRLIPVLPGIGAGVYSAKRESEGKDSKLLNHVGGLTGVAINIPTLVEEGRASNKAIKMIKKAGASKPQLKASKKALAGTYGTYLLKTAGQAGLGYASQGVGKLVGRGIYGKPGSKIKDNSNETSEKDI